MNRLADRAPLTIYARAALVALLLVAVVLVWGSGSRGGETDAPGDVALGVTRPGSVRVGAPAPDFVLAQPDGTLISLSDLRGKTVALHFFATWCGPSCHRDLLELQAAVEERADGELAVLAVNFGEPPEFVQRFLDEHGLTVPVVLDNESLVTGSYGVEGLPQTLFIDTEGIIREVQRGPIFGHLLEDGIAAADAHHR